MHRLTTLLATLLVVAPAAAQAPVEAGDDAEIHRFTVEVIIFRYAEDVAGGSELFLPDQPEPPPDEETPEFSDVAPQPEAKEQPEALPDTEFALLLDEDMELTDAYDKLERLDAYEPLMHFGWTQAAWPQEQTEPIPLYRFGRPPEGLDGTLTLYLSRYLHLVVDLALRAPEAQVPARSTSGFNGLDSFGVEPTLPTYYRIAESRILKNGELRYFDHPKFGVLARVSRIEAEDPAPEDGELLGYPLQ